MFLRSTRLRSSWDYLDLGQVVDRAWDILGYPLTSWTSLDIHSQYDICSKVFVGTVREDLESSEGQLKTLDGSCDC